MPTLDKYVSNLKTLDYFSLDKYRIDSYRLDGIQTSNGIDSYTNLMLHMNGTNGSTTFTDSSLSPKTVSVYGNAQISTAAYKFGGASGLFDGSGDYLQVPDSSDWTFGSSNWTIDFQVKRITTGTVQKILSQAPSDGSATGTSIDIDFIADNTLRCVMYYGSSFKLVSYALSDTTSFHHIAFVRNGNTVYMYIDAVQVATVDVTGVSINDSTIPLTIGRAGNYSSGYAYLNAYLDEFRISNIARSITTAPTSEYTT